MKRLTKGLLALFLVASLVTGVFAATGVLSSAYALQDNVYAQFSGADKHDWATLSGTTIQDSALSVDLTNGHGNKPIKIVSYSCSSTGVTLANFSKKEVAAGSTASFNVTGTTANKSVLWVSIKYYIVGNIEKSAETATAYIYASADENYTSATANSKMGFYAGSYQHNNLLTLSEISSGSVSTTERKVSQWFFGVTQDGFDGNMNAELYVDGSWYETFTDLGMKFTLKENGERAYAIIDQVEMSQTSSTGSLSLLNNFSTSPTDKNHTYTFDKEDTGSFYVQAQEKTDGKEFQVGGTIPTETTVQTYTLKFRTHGQVGDILSAVISGVSPDCYFNVTLKVYNVNKTALRNKLDDIAKLGLNKESFPSGNWTTFENKLMDAYKTLGTLNATWTNVSTALTNAESAKNTLLPSRLAVVFTNHYFYYGGNTDKPLPLKDKNGVSVQDVKMNHTIGNDFTVGALTTEDSSGNLIDFKVDVYDPDTEETREVTVNINRRTLQSKVKITSSILNNFVTEVNQYYWFVDISQLQAAIDAQANKVHQDEGGLEMYTDESWNAYVQAANNGNTAKTKTDLYQYQIDDYTNKIESARKALIRKPMDTAWYEEGQEWARQILENEYENEDFGWNTNTLFNADDLAALRSVYDEAVAIFEEDNYTQTTIYALADRLWDAIFALRTQDPTGLMVTDDETTYSDPTRYGRYVDIGDLNNKDEDYGLTDLLADILDNTQGTYRLNKSDFTKESWDALCYAIYGEYDKESFDEDFFTPENFDFATFYVETAGRSTSEGYYRYNNDELELTVPAYTMLHNIWFLPTQEDYNACYDNLVDKVNNLTYELDLTALTEAYEQAKEIEADDYSAYIASTTTSLKNAIPVLDEMMAQLEEPQRYGDADAIKQSKINSTVTSLRRVIGKLQLRPTVIEKDEDISIVSNQEEDSLPVITGEAIGTTAQEALAHLDIQNNSDAVEVNFYDSENNKIEMTDTMGTGYKIKLESKDGDETFTTLVYMVKGDVAGDAVIDQKDFNKVFNYSFTDSGIQENSVFFDAADINGDGVVDLLDAVLIKRMAAANA